ncbi:thioredoxin family protein [bacterium]|nr:thioredoxin family protein [bacterium]
MKNIFIITLTLLIGIVALNCGTSTDEQAAGCCGDATAKKELNCDGCTADNSAPKTAAEAKVTFIELGAKTCIPCKQMVPVMAAVEKDFGSQLNVIFVDVKQERKKAREFRVRLIPTQVFLDSTGAEFFRHEGFLPQAEIEKLLLEKGLSKITN